MRKNNLQCRIKLKQKMENSGEHLIVPGLLKRDFMTNEPNKKWVTDITYIQYDNTTKHLSTIINLFNTEIVTCKLYVHQQTPLVIDTLQIALENWDHPEGTIIHSDHGAVYISYAFQGFIKRHRLLSSMSRKGNCRDNAVIESFHSNLKSEKFQYLKFNSLKDHEVDEQITYTI